jgi:hypothetical protein
MATIIECTKGHYYKVQETSYGERRKKRDDYLRAEYNDWLEGGVIEEWGREKTGGRHRGFLPEVQASCTT